MIVGEMVTRALQRTKLPVGDYPTREFALDILNEVIQEHWNYRKWNFRKSSFSFKTAQNVEEYVLNKYADQIVPNSFRGSDSTRLIRFRPSHDFYWRNQGDTADGDPNEYRDGEMMGVQRQVSGASTITVSSSLTSKSAGTVAVIYGDTRMTLSTETVTVDDLGKWIRVGSDYKRYKVVSLEPNNVGSSSSFYVNEAYAGTTDASATYSMGDINQKVVIQGYDTTGVSIQSEEIQLNGASSRTSTKSFYALIRISKSDKTHGFITATSNGGAVTNITLDPGELDCTFRTIKLHPVPEGEELLRYESYGRHPYLYKMTDSPWFPDKYHPFLLLDLIIRLNQEHHQRDVSQDMLRRREKMLNDMIVNDNDMDEWNIKQESDVVTADRAQTNLPGDFGFYEDWDL